MPRFINSKFCLIQLILVIDTCNLKLDDCTNADCVKDQAAENYICNCKNNFIKFGKNVVYSAKSILLPGTTCIGIQKFFENF